MELTYPYYPRADWRFAVSRRFNLPHVDALYSQCILPALEGEGLILECWYASEQTKDLNFWMNRMSLMLELADIHILVDVDKSANVQFEFDRSRCLFRRPQASSLVTNFNWSPMTERTIIRPVVIVIERGVGRDWRSPRRRKAVLHLADEASPADFVKRLRAEIVWAKTQRLKRLNKVKDIYEKKVRLMGLASSDLEFSLVKMTELAERMINNESVDNLLYVSHEAESREKTAYQVLNESFDWHVRLKKGEIILPHKFGDTYAVLRDRYRKGVASFTSPQFANYRIVKWLTSVGALSMAIKIRRSRKHKRRK
jgi:hypothetical protein